MSKELKEPMKESIYTLLGQGYSNRKIAEILNVNRKTVNKYAKLYHQNGPKVPTGSEEQNGPKVPAGSEEQNGPKAPAGFQSRSRCGEFHDVIIDLVEKKGLSAVRVHRDLREEYGFEVSYDSVKRYIRKLKLKNQLPFRRIETVPGEEAQVDFGQGAWICYEDKKRKRPNLLVVTLSYSRACYEEVVFGQTTENFIRAIENAFRHFGGVPKKIIIDNLKAAVKRHDWFDPELNRKVIEFARHYNTVIVPTKPYTPEHKGKVESSVKYIQNNALKGRSFASISAQNIYLRKWQTSVANTRIHGTTKRQVGKMFEEEKKHLQPLPMSLFPCFEEASRVVHRDGYVEVQRAYYSVPVEYCRRNVWVRWDGRLVRIFNHRWEQIALHQKVESGQFSTNKNHIDSKKATPEENGMEYYLRKAAGIGENVRIWAEELFKKRGNTAFRAVMGLINLKKKHPIIEIDKGCELAIELDVFSLQNLRKIIENPPTMTQPEFTFKDDDEIIRDMSVYERVATWENQLEALPQHPS